MKTNLLPCPCCNGEANLKENTDNSVNLRVYHDDDCPMCIDSNGPHWSVYFYEEDFDLSQGTLYEQISKWWNHRYERTTPDDKLLCQHCGYSIVYRDDDGEVLHFEHCPHCGAKVTANKR